MADDQQLPSEQKAASSTTTSSSVKDTPLGPADAAHPGIMTLLYKGFFDWFKTKKAKAAIVAFLLITVTMGGIFQFQHDTIKAISLSEAIAGGGSSGGGGGKDPFAKFTDQTGKAPLSGNSQAGAAASAQKVVIADKNVFQIVAVVSWTDEADSTRHTNQPDTFEIQVTSPDGRTSKGSAPNEHGKEGVVEVVLARNITQEVLNNKDLKKKTQDMTWTGDWNITVACTNAGAQTPIYGPDPIHLRDQADPGNAWKLDVNWTFKGQP
jgi:hypothetical protein